MVLFKDGAIRRSEPTALHETNMQLRLIKLLAIASLLLGIGDYLAAQGPPLPSTLGAKEGTGWIMVYIRSEHGLPVPVSALPQMTLTAADNSPVRQSPRMDGNGWVFSSLATGVTYELEVKVDGYQPARETVTVPAMDYGSAAVTVFLKPKDEQLTLHPPTGAFVLAPRTQKEVDKGLRDMNSGKISSAQKHFQNAIHMAPGNPYVNYVTGMSYLLARQLPSAQLYLEESVSVDPKQVPSLLALGTLRFEEANYPGAIDVLNKAVQLDPASWKSQWMLSAAYLHQRDYRQARDHAERALANGKESASQVELILGEALARLGERQRGIIAFETFLTEHPGDSSAPRIRAWVEDLRKDPLEQEKRAVTNVAQVPAAATDPIAVHLAVPAAELPPKGDWAPPDVDSQKPPLISGAACSLPRVLKSAERNATKLVSDLQQFTSLEEYQSVEIKRNESVENPLTRTFSYMVFIEQPRPGAINVSEFRDQGLSATDMPGPLEDGGAPALVLAFHPFFRDDFTWNCEGLSEWGDRPAWIVRFEQRSDRPNRLASFRSASGTYGLPLKGRAWISEKGGQVVHMETDLVNPIAPIRLKREHFVIDYQPITFRTHKVTLWLPQNVDVYYQFRGHYLHHYHHYSNFKLFWTGSSQKIGMPKEASQPQ